MPSHQYILHQKQPIWLSAGFGITRMLYLESCKAHNEPTPGQPGIEALDVGFKEPAD